MSKSPSGFSGGTKANKILGVTGAPKPTGSKPTPSKTPPPKPTAPKPTAVKSAAPKPGFTPGVAPKKTPKLAPGAPVLGQQRMANPAKAPQEVNKQRLEGTFKKLGF